MLQGDLCTYYDNTRLCNIPYLYHAFLAILLCILHNA